MQSPSEELKTFQTTLKKKYQIFISSTFTDLKKEREAAVEAILKAGHIPAGMELFKAGKETLETIQKWIDESDLYILILGGRYGSIHEESGKSYTEIEYRYALEKNKFPFAIIIKDEALKNKVKDLGEKDAIEVNNTDKYDAFKKYVQKSICAFFDDEKDIKLHIANNITNIINENGHLLNGWISGRDANFQFIEEVTEKNDFPMAVPPPEKMTIEKRAQIIKKKKEFEEYKRGYFMPDSYAMDDSKKFVADLYNILTDKINSLEDKKYQIRHNQRNSNLINIIYEGLVLIFEWRIKYGNSLTDSSLKVAIKKWTQLDTIPLPTESWTVSQSYEYDFGINEDHQNVWGDKKKPSYIFNNTEIADMWLNLFMNELES
ncbi:MAG: DUF4062 domain-containing protein [Bacteroidetes bacterium]|nr:DUF4062 domain-containing protein [Bacteroidota bacterium]